MTATDTECSLDILEELDFKHAPSCEHQEHGYDDRHNGPAYYLLKSHCPKCNKNKVYYICKSAYLRYHWLWCQECGYAAEKNEFWTILGTVS